MIAFIFFSIAFLIATGISVRFGIDLERERQSAARRSLARKILEMRCGA